MSEGARANSIWLTCPLGHVKQWHARGVHNGAAKWCTAAGICGRPLRRLTEDEQATMIVGGPDAVACLVARKFQIAQEMEIVTRDDGMELWVCTKGHITPFKSTAVGKWIACPRTMTNPYIQASDFEPGSLQMEASCAASLVPATRAQVSAWLIGGEAAVVIP